MDLATGLDPYPAYASLREFAPVYHNGEHDFWALARYDDVRSASQDWETFSSAEGVEVDDADELFGIGGGDFLASDPPKHDVLRDVVRRSFTPKAVAELEQVIRLRATDLMSQSLDIDVLDVARDLAQPLPVYVIGRLLGLPEADDPAIRSHVEDVFVRVPGQRSVPEPSRAAARDLRTYLGEETRLAEAARRSKLARALLDAEEDGRISRIEATDIMVLLLAAAIKTTSGLISHLLLRLAEHPPQRALLLGDRSLIPAAVEEALRYDAPAQWLTRVTTTDAAIAGTAIPKGARVLLLYGSANRDERRFANPDVFDIARPAQRHLGFGNGIHFCLGAPIARLEARVTLEVLLERVRDFEIAGPVERLYAPAERELSALPMHFTPSQPREPTSNTTSPSQRYAIRVPFRHACEIGTDLWSPTGPRLPALAWPAALTIVSEKVTMGETALHPSSSRTMTPELYDPLFHTPQDNVYDVYAVLRRDHPVYFNKQRGVWCLSRYVDVQMAARDWKTFATAPGVNLEEPNPAGPGDFIDADPPRHDVLRNVVRPYFVPKAVAELAVDITARVDGIIAELRERGSADLALDFAWRLPIWVICRLLGTPEQDDQMLQKTVLDVSVRHPGGATVPERAKTALAELHAYLSDLAGHKRRHPDDRVLSRMVAGEPEGVPTPTETVGMATMFFMAGTETTFALLGNAVNLLSENPDALHALRRDERSQLIEAVIEEAVRFEAPVQYLARTVTASTTLQGVDIPEGGRVVLMWGAANRDPDRWKQPDRFDIGREPRRHVGFGEGIHFCLGAPLARLEARIALPAFSRAFAEYNIGEKRRMDSHIVRGWQRLDATLTPNR